MSGWNVYLPGRRVAFTRQDEQAYLDLLVERFPDARVFPEPPLAKRRGPNPPSVRPSTIIPDGDDDVLSIVFDRDWQPVWEWHDEYKLWFQAVRPYPNANFDRSQILPKSRQWKRFGRGFDPPRIDTASLYYRCRKDVPDDMKLARAALRLVGKIASNRNQIVYRYPSMRVYFEHTKGSELWIGRDARRWLLEQPDRMADYFRPERLGVRPKGDADPG